MADSKISTITNNRKGSNSVPVLTKEGLSKTVPRDVVEFWMRRVQDDFMRNTALRGMWDHNVQMVANTGAGLMEGNLVAEFSKTTAARLLDDDIMVKVTPVDQGPTADSEKARIVAQALVDTLDLKDVAKNVMYDAIACSFGVFDIRHPADPSSFDIWNSIRNQNVEVTDVAIQDEWEEVDPSELDQFGPTDGQVAPLTKEMPFIPPSQLASDEKSEPVFSPITGYPYVERVDPRLIVMPYGTKDPRRAGYIARIRFLSPKEIETVQGIDLSNETYSTSELNHLFEQTEKDGDMSYYDNIIPVVELYVRRDRRDPSWNNWFFVMVYGRTDFVIRSEFNQNGSYLPYEFLILDRTKDTISTPLATELAPYAKMYAAGIRSSQRQMIKNLADKTLVGRGNTLDKVDKENLTSSEYSGIVEVDDVQQVKDFRTPGFDMDHFRFLTFVKSLAQSTSLQSEIDRGQAIKSITASQTQALVDATGINIQELQNQINRTLKSVVTKVMYMAGKYTMLRKGHRFSFNGRFAEFSLGHHDFTTSYTYNVSVNDKGEAFSDERRIIWIQFLKLIQSDQQGIMLPFIDGPELLKSTVRLFGQPHSIINQQSVDTYNATKNQQQGGLPMDPNLGLALGGGMGNNELEQHPERDKGSRGLDLGNMMRGQLKLGSGMGE